MKIESAVKHTEKKEEILFEALSAKIALIREFMNRALALRGERVISEMDALWNEVQQLMPVRDRGLYAEWKRARDIVETYEYESTSPSAEDQEDSFKERKMASQRMSQISAEDKQHALLFLGTMDKVVFDLKQKYLAVRSLTSSPDPVSSCVERLQRHYSTFAYEDVMLLTQEDPFTLILTLTPQGFKKCTDAEWAGGLFIPRTPFCLMKNGIANHDALVRHERLHAFTEVVAPTRHPLENLVTTIAAIKDMAQENYFGAENALADFDLMLIDALHGEMISAIEHAMEKDLSDPQSSLEKYIHAFSTAGKHVSDILAFLEEEKMEGGPAVRLISSLKDKLEKRFIEMGEALSRAADMIRGFPLETQVDAKEEMLVLMCCLPPNKYKHVPIYMSAWRKRKIASDNNI